MSAVAVECRGGGGDGLVICGWEHENNATEAGGRRSATAMIFKFEVPAKRALCKSIV